MNKFSLTEEHKYKLKEMCHDLFAENLLVADIENETFVLVDNIRIHWFEFCLNNLPLKIVENYNTVDYTEKHRQLFDVLVKKMSGIYPIFNNSQNNHPVDYLYDMYEKSF